MEEKEAIKVSKITIVINVTLSVIKLIAGIIANSSAMVSDAIHSASDVVSTIIVIIGVKLSNKESDKSHQYGHERYECVASIILSTILSLTGAGIGIAGIQKIATGEYKEFVIPGIVALIAAVISIIVKEAMYWYTRRVAKKINSGALMADAWHHRSDALSSIGSFIRNTWSKVWIFNIRLNCKCCNFSIYHKSRNRNFCRDNKKNDRRSL